MNNLRQIMVVLITALFIGVIFSTSAIADEFDDALKLWKAGNYDEAFSIFHRLADSGNIWAQKYAGIAYEKGRGVEKNPDKAKEYLKSSAIAGSKSALYRLMKNYHEYLDFIEFNNEDEIIKRFLGQYVTCINVLGPVDNPLTVNLLESFELLAVDASNSGVYEKFNITRTTLKDKPIVLVKQRIYSGRTDNLLIDGQIVHIYEVGAITFNPAVTWFIPTNGEAESSAKYRRYEPMGELSRRHPAFCNSKLMNRLE